MKRTLQIIFIGGVLVAGFLIGNAQRNLQAEDKVQAPVTSDKYGGETNPTRDYFDAEGNKYDYQGNLIQPVQSEPVQVEAPKEQSSCR